MKLHHQLNAQLLRETSIPSGVHPVIELMLTRLKTGSQRGKRTDGRTIALAIEGGGFRGAISGGMCVVLEAAGLIDTIDIIYGTSSGALNGAFTAAGQAALGLTNYVDTANRHFFNPFRILSKRKVIDIDFLLDTLIRNRKPLNEQGFETGPEFRAIAVDPAKQSVEVLMNFKDADELLQAVRVSCALPFMTGPTPTFRGVPMIDGGILAPIPYKPALEQGATDVLILRSRPAGSRKKKRAPKLTQKVLQTTTSPIVSLLVKSQRAYNHQAEELLRLSSEKGNVYQIAPPADIVPVQIGEHSLEKIRAGTIAGARAAADAFSMPAIDLYWHPVPYTIK